MVKDATYTNGVIAVKEKYLLKDKIFKMCEGGAEEALRALTDSGFGRGTEIASVYEYEKLVAADEEAIDGFIREYAPARAEAEYLLAPRDFHNAKALVKAHFTGLDADKLLAPEGLIPVSHILQCIEEGKYDGLGKILGGAVKEAADAFSKDGGASGAEIGNIFEKALYSHLFNACARNPLLKRLIAVKADMTNILTALRSVDRQYALNSFVSGGKLSNETLLKLLNDDRERAAHSLDNTPYAEFVKKCFADRSEGLPLTEAERLCENYEIQYFSAKKYDLIKNQPFLYYVFRRRAENTNVRILFVCLLAGMRDSEIKKRLR